MNFTKIERLVVCDPAQWKISADRTLGVAGFCHWQAESSAIDVDDLAVILHREPERLNQLRGEFCLWFIRGKKIFLVRDPIGIVPFYYAINSLVFVATTQFAIRQWVSSKPRPEFVDLVCKHDFSDLSSTSRRNIWRVPPGRTVTLEEGSVRCHRNWHIPPAARELDAMVLVAGAVEMRMSQSGATGLLLSGGFDSGLLGHLMVASEKKGKGLARSYSLVFSQPPEDERDSLNQVLQSSRIENEMLLDSDVNAEEFWLKREDLIAGLFYDPTLMLFRPLLRAACRQGSGLVFTGLGGDDLFSNRLSGAQVLGGLLPSGVFKWLLQLTGSQRAPLLLSTSQISRGPGHFAMLERFIFSGGYAFGIEQEQELASSLGVRMSYPLLDTNVVEYAASTYGLHSVFSSDAKKALRKAARGIMPESLRTRVSRQGYDQWRYRILEAQFRCKGSVLHWIISQKKLNFPNSADGVNPFLLELFKASQMVRQGELQEESVAYGERQL